MRGLTIQRTLVLVLFALIFAMAARVPVDSDMWWHLRSGEAILGGSFIREDSFSHTMTGAPWVNHSWGAQVIMTVLWQAAGSAGLAFYMAALATGGMVFVWLMARGNPYVSAFALIIGAAAAAVFWSPRPQMLSFFFSALVLWLLLRYQRGESTRLWPLPVVMGVWGNLHAGFSIGFIFMALVIAGEALGNLTTPRRTDGLRWRQIARLVLFALLSAAAVCVNPFGVSMLLVPFQTLGIGALRAFIQEWNPPNFHEAQTLPFLALLFLTFGAVGAARRRLSWTEFALVAGTGYLAFTAGRNIAVFAVVATPVFAGFASDALAARGWQIRPVRRVSPVMAAANALIVLVVLAGAALKFASVSLASVVDVAVRAANPVEALQAMRAAGAPGPLFNSYNWGGWLIYAAHEYPVFVDGRTDLYGDAFLSKVYLPTALGAPGYEETLQRYGVNTVLVEPESGLARMLSLDEAWQALYSDAQASAFVRRSPLAPQEGADDAGQS